MKFVPKKLRAVFAAATLGLVALPAVAQEAPATPAPVAAPVQPDFDSFQPQSFFLGPDTRGARYLCGDDTQNCWTQDERDAGAVREFQMMMMSTAYACKYKPGMADLVDQYNSFVTNSQPTLAALYHTVEHRLQAQSPTPRAGSRAMDALDTQNANMYSGAAARDGFCEAAAPVLRYVATLQDDADMVRVAQRIIRPQQPPAV